MSIHVLVIEGHALFRNGISRLIQSEPDLEVVGEGSSAAEGHQLLAATGADVLILDAWLPDGSSLDLARATRQRHAAMGIVVLTARNDDDTLLGALDAGVSALVLKDASSAELIHAVRQAATSPGSFSAKGLSPALRRQQDIAPQGMRRAHLTPREDQVLQHLVAGESVAQVACQLFMSESTVRAHVGQAYDKLGANQPETIRLESSQPETIRAVTAQLSAIQLVVPQRGAHHGSPQRGAKRRAAGNLAAVR
jgi:DNA-binding NarL/FixJ family response regulator